jgi:hypothetical protein
MEASELLRKIDMECDRIHGTIYTRDSNMWINLRDHRRWMHPQWNEYIQRLKLKEEKGQYNKDG